MQSEHERHDFRGKPMTLDEFGKELAAVVRFAKESPAWDALPWNVRQRIGALESHYQRMREGLERSVF